MPNDNRVDYIIIIVNRAKKLRDGRGRIQPISMPKRTYANARERKTPTISTVPSLSSATGAVTARGGKGACLPLQGGLAASFCVSALLQILPEVYRKRLRARGALSARFMRSRQDLQHPKRQNSPRPTLSRRSGMLRDTSRVDALAMHSGSLPPKRE